MVEPVLDQHDTYHRFSYCIEGAAALSAILLTRHRVGYIALAALAVVQGVAAGFAPNEVSRLEDSDFIRPKAWRHYSRQKFKTAQFWSRCLVAVGVLALPLSIGGSMLAFTGAGHLWGEMKFYRAIKGRMTKVLKLHELDMDEVTAADLTKKIRKIKAKTLNDAAWEKLEKLPKLRKLTIDTLPEDLELPNHRVFTTIVLRDPKEGWHKALAECSWIERIVIKGKVKPEDVEKILKGKHKRLRVIELKFAAGMQGICGGSYHWVPPKSKARAKIKVSMR